MSEWITATVDLISILASIPLIMVAIIIACVVVPFIIVLATDAVLGCIGKGKSSK